MPVNHFWLRSRKLINGPPNEDIDARIQIGFGSERFLSLKIIYRGRFLAVELVEKMSSLAGLDCLDEINR